MARDVLICNTTQLALLLGPAQPVYRLADPHYGPLRPRLRPTDAPDNRSTWHRYDLAGERTIYAASSLEGMYAEILQPLKKPEPTPAGALFDDVGEGETVQDLIAHDFAEDGKEPPHEIDLDWLLKRRLYTMLLPTAGWFIGAEHSSTIAYLNRNRPPVLLAKGLQQVTVAVLRGEDRYVTSHLAETMAGPRLQDQTRPIGLFYGSKLGSDWDCWAVAARRGAQCDQRRRWPARPAPRRKPGTAEGPEAIRTFGAGHVMRIDPH